MAVDRRWSRARLSLLVLFGSTACGDGFATGPEGHASGDAQDVAVEPIWLRRVDAGLALTRTSAQFTGLHARMAGGVCVFDVDGDGNLDVFFAQPASAGGSRLYRGHGAFAFEDVTSAYGLSGADGEGCAVFDVEGDGDADLVVTTVGDVRLHRNDGGKLTLEPGAFGSFDADVHLTAAVALDADDDGDLDLAVGSYGRFVPPLAGADCIVSPCDVNDAYYQGGRALLFLQRADGSFVDGSARLGAGATGKVLVLLATDLDEDGRLDLFVGHDDPKTPDLYLARDAAGAWSDRASAMGLAKNARNNGISSMSAADVDLDGDGRLDLVESSWEDDPDAVFRCPGAAGGACTEIGDALELFRGPKNLRWGQAIGDLDDDGLVEIFEGVGQVYRAEDLTKPGSHTFAPATGPSVLWHRSALSAPFSLAPTDEGLALSLAARGALAIDFDGDGALDVVVAPALGDALLLRGVHRPRGHFLGVSLHAKGKNPHAVGARVVVHAGTRSFPALVHAGEGYLSAIDHAAAPLHFGLGAATTVDVDVTWPSGAQSHASNVAVDRVVTLAEP